LTEISELHTIFIITMTTLMMETVSTFEMSVTFNQHMWCSISEDVRLHSHCHENLKSHVVENIFFLPQVTPFLFIAEVVCWVVLLGVVLVA
jgi:hypothetical protein